MLSVVLLDGSDQPETFAMRGKSTLLLTTKRLIGVCPQGETTSGAFCAEEGPVAVWTISLSALDQVTVARSATAEHAVIRSKQEHKPGCSWPGHAWWCMARCNP